MDSWYFEAPISRWMMAQAAKGIPVGQLLRRWRQDKRLSQMELANRVGISTRHLSFVETGRSNPSRELILSFGSTLDVSLREQNRVLLAAGFSPAFRESNLESPEMSEVRGLLELILKGQEPFPALVIDGHWKLCQANAPSQMLTQMLCRDPMEACVGQPPNLLRLVLHPEGIRHRLLNWPEVGRATLARAERELETDGDDEFRKLISEIRSYPGVKDLFTNASEKGDDGEAKSSFSPILIPLCFEADGEKIELISTVTTLGTAQDITLQDLRIETFYPATKTSEAWFRARCS